MIKRIQPKEQGEMGKTQITGIKNALKELNTEQKPTNTRDDRAAFVQVGRVEHVRLLHETSCYENISDNEGISDQNGSTESENEFIQVILKKKIQRKRKEEKPPLKKLKERKEKFEENWTGHLALKKVHLSLIIQVTLITNIVMMTTFY